MTSFITQLRSYHVADMALFDFTATALVAFVIARFIHWNAAVVFVFLLVAAIIIHYELGIPTRLNAYLGLNTVDEVYAARVTAERG